MDNLEMERWFRQPKRHERRIHGRQHAGVRIVQEGPTLLPTLNAHELHCQPFTASELLPYRNAQEPLAQTQAILRRKIMRKASGYALTRSRLGVGDYQGEAQGWHHRRRKGRERPAPLQP